MDCFASLAMTTWNHRGTRSDAGSKSAHPPQISFIIFVDAIFTTLFERLFTNVFEVMA
jgi:hypothetical protein